DGSTATLQAGREIDRPNERNIGKNDRHALLRSKLVQGSPCGIMQALQERQRVNAGDLIRGCDRILVVALGGGENVFREIVRFFCGEALPLSLGALLERVAHVKDRYAGD